MAEFISNAKFYFEADGLTEILIQKISGMQMKMTVAGGDAPIGVTKDGKTQTQATIGGVECSEITIECVATADSKQLLDWYNKCHAEALSGGKSEGRKNRKLGKLSIYDGQDEKVQYEFTDVFPTSYGTGDFSAGSGDLLTETVTVGFTYFERKK
ncbi:phage tail protein [Nostoc sp. CENA67]|uniref:Phage tail protein n=1 Tax=Amazonocrinis nigriterrae CENA67 TaxID=2794033 RepID=A0A8J7L566_9NOST|nr:phage tail protein [Amazonocrinis nigriterrae]MBH8560929.1 phage tail protein [Amazonocrinis nigriterrae CENA67]